MNGTFIKRNKNPATLSGTLFYQKSNSYIYITLHGMDFSTMTPLLFGLGSSDGLTTSKRLDLDCSYAQDGLEDREHLSGRGHLRFYDGGCELSAECYTKTRDLWVLKSSNVESKEWYYPQKEAGFRAKFLINQPESKYKPQDVISFAMEDYPYIYKNCGDFLESWFLDVLGPEPGGIMVGKDKKHCAILDDEGTKFTHSNPVAGKVTYDSIAVAERYFPSGIVYKRWPDL